MTNTPDTPDNLPPMICGACNEHFYGTGAAEAALTHMQTEHNEPAPDQDEVDLCKGCNTMKHLDANGLCGRCQPDPKRTLDKENSYMGDITPDQDGLIEFLDDPETLKKAVEGSMDKRIAKLDQVDALDDLQKQIWQAATANKDNPLGYRILDAHFAKLSALLVEAKVSENEFWADIAIDSKPAQYDFQDRIKELEKQREATG